MNNVVQFTFFQALFDKLGAALSTYWLGVASSVVAAITPVATSLLMIYVMLWGWSMMRGVISEPVADGMWRMLRLSLIVGIALSVGRYGTYLADMLWNSPDVLAAVVVGDKAGAGSNVQFLDHLLSEFYALGRALIDQANALAGPVGMPDLGLLFTGFAVWAGGAMVTGYAAFLFVLSKSAVAILLGVGPIFVLMTIFDATKRFFDAWLGQVLNFVFLVMLTAAASKLILTIIESYIGSPGLQTAMADPNIAMAFPAIVFSIIGFLVMMQLPSIASSLGGGVAISTLGAVGAAWSRAKGGTGLGFNLANGKVLSDYRGFRKHKALNASWAANNPSLPRRALSAPAAIVRGMRGESRNSVRREN